MPDNPIRVIVPRLRELVSAQDSQISDRDLLHRFSDERDEAAFAEIVRRHAPMLLRVSQRVLRNTHDAEEIAQATFLLLAQKAASMRWHDSVSGWLFQTAYRLSLKARTAAHRRAHHESRATPAPPADPLVDLNVRELQTVLDEELSGLPEKYRSPIILCCLEGRSRDEAADCLGWPLAKVKDRLERGRERLRCRLARRGVLLSTALTSAWLLESPALAGLSPHTITRGALSLATGEATLATLLPPHMFALVKGGTTTMLVCRLTILAAALGLALGTAAAVTRLPDDPPPTPAQASKKKPAPAEAVAAKEAAPAQPEALPLVGHKGAVNAVAFARVRKTVATAGSDGTVRIWNSVTGDLIHKLDQPGKPVGVAFSPDGKMLAAVSVGKGGEVVVWDAVTGKKVWRNASTPPGRNLGGGGGVAFSPDGSMVMAGMAGGVTMGFQAAAGIVFFAFRASRGGGTAVAYSADGKTVVVGDDGGAVQQVDSATGRALRIWRGKNNVTALAFFPTGTRVAVADGSKALRILDITTGKEETRFESKEEVVTLAVSAGARRLATAGAGGAVLLWDTAGKQERRFSAGGAVNALAFSPDGKQLATAGADGVILWNLTRDDKPLPRDFKLSAKELEARWADLASDDGGKAYAAMRYLRADPARSLPFLQKRLTPKDTGPDPKKVKQLIADLDSDEFKKRESAAKELEDLGEAVESAMRDALAAKPSLEVTRRLERLLKRLEDQRQTLTAEQQRDVRALRVLEQVGTPEAKKLLEALSKKATGWWVRREATQALLRLGKGEVKR
jgi:RNA polymerase sigma factor (sigma-70 family)